jgi:hypothetical protein
MYFERLDLQALKAVHFAGKQGVSQQSCSIETELILLGLIAQEIFGSNAMPPQLEGVLYIFDPLLIFKDLNITLIVVQEAICQVLEPVMLNQAKEEIMLSSSQTANILESQLNSTTVSIIYGSDLPFSERSNRVFKKAAAAADLFGNQFISVFHLLLGIVEEGQELIDGQQSNAVRVLEYLGVNIQELQEQILQILQHQD